VKHKSTQPTDARAPFEQFLLILPAAPLGPPGQARSTAILKMLGQYFNLRVADWFWLYYWLSALPGTSISIIEDLIGS
jgi:hypothetical protein